MSNARALLEPGWYVAGKDNHVFEIEGHRFNRRYTTFKQAYRNHGKSEGRILEYEYVGKPGGNERLIEAFECGGRFYCVDNEYRDKLLAELADIRAGILPITKQGRRVNTGSPWGRPLVSKAMSVHPSQAAQFNEDAHKMGTGAFYDPQTGDAHFESNGSRNAELIRRRMYDKDAGYRQYAGGQNAA